MQKRPGSISPSDCGLCFRPPGTHAVPRDEAVVGNGGWGCKGEALQRAGPRQVFKANASSRSKSLKL